ncbi:GumC family protein [Palleronia sp.]|uniref:GumC family protein n=1 Tax=Palleronia sp. TaxID=1940284 RepID=UPI0035C7C69F
MRQPTPVDLGYIFATLRFRWRWIALPIIGFSGLGLLASLYSEERYVSKATLLIEPPRVSNGGTDAILTQEIETLRLVEQYALSDAVLADLAADLGALDEKPEDLRERIEITTSGGPGRGAPGAPITVEISFTAPKAEMSKRASSEIVAYVLSEHTARRAGLADGTLQYFSRETDRLAADLAKAEGELRDFERQNQPSLPEALSFSRMQRAEMRSQLMQIDRDRAELEAELVGLAAGGGLTAQPGASDQLAKLRSERAALAAVLSPGNPRLIALDAQIQAMEAEPAAGPTPGAEPELQSRLSALAVQREDMAAEIHSLSLAIEETPRIASLLAALEREVRAAERNYETALAQRVAAETGAQVEHMSADSRIAVLHPATSPEQASSPGRATLAWLGAAFGFFAGLFLTVAREMFDTTIRRPADLRDAIGLDPFAVLPMLAPTRRKGLRPSFPLRFARIG